MEIQEYLKYRVDLLNESKDEDGFINESNFINSIIPSMLDAKLIDTEDFTETYYSTEIDGSAIKINGYIINDSGERLQLFILNEESISFNNNNLEISQKEYYESQFKKAITFTKKAINGNLKDIQDIGAINALINQMASSLGADQFDVIEIFLVSATATVENRGQTPHPKRLEFKDDTFEIRYTKQNPEKNRPPFQAKKEILIIKRLIDLNFLHNVLISQGNREALTINFEEQFDFRIEVIKAADETNFESYLCVFPANILAELYKRFSSRLLEKNVRSFLQFRGVNQGIRKTIINEPEKFIAFNNGLTITASDKVIEEINGKYYLKSLTDFQIVNGGQTTASIYFTQKDGIDVGKVRVMAKINIAKNVSEKEIEDLIFDISNYSNSQTRVSPVDRITNHLILIKIKSLSESIITPSGRKWFFEKSKGEFNTKLRIAGQSGKNRIEKEYPKEFRFTKEQLGKYYSAWDKEPFKVKKGGEAITRKFIENISLAEKEKQIIIDRNFYELLISKIILFKSLEEIYGVRNNAIGQLRSAVVPYTVSILFSKTEGDKKNPKTFDLARIWTNEGLEDDLKVYLKELMSLVNELIKEYAKSDDLGEYSKKKELWDDIYSSNELKEFLNTENSIKIFDKYSISKKELEKKTKASLKKKEVDFQILRSSVEIYSRGVSYYKEVIQHLEEANLLDDDEKNRIESLIRLINARADLKEIDINFEERLTNKIKVETPWFFDKIKAVEDPLIIESLELILKNYNNALVKNEDITSVFTKITKIGEQKKISYASIFSEIGKKLSEGITPSVKDIYYAKNFFVN